MIATAPSAGAVAAPPALVPPALAASTRFLLLKVAQALTRELEEALAPLGLRPRHLGALLVLEEGAPMSQCELGELLRLDSSTVVDVVDELEQRGLVTRRRNPHDRRAYVLELTAEGAADLERARGVAQAADRECFGALAPDELAGLHQALTTLAGCGRVLDDGCEGRRATRAAGARGRSRAASQG
jgi:MarR family transcriptional regulator, lower aerobic nicotinate degradation pathway regulator